VGVLAATFSVLPALLAYQIGRLSDRYGARWPLLFGIGGGGLGIIVPFFFHSIPALFVAAILNGLAFAFYNVSLQAVIGQLSAPNERTRNFNNFTLVVSTGNLIAPLAVGFSIDFYGHANTCLYLACVALAPVAMLIARGRALPKAAAREARAGGNLLATLREPQVRRVMVINSLLQTGFEQFLFYMPVYAHGAGLSASAIGVVMSLYSIGGFMVRMVLERLLKRYSVETVLTAAFFVGAITFALMPFFSNAWMLGLLAFIFGFGMSVGQPITLSLSFSNAKDGRSGELMGLRQSVNHATRIAVPVVFGGLAGLGSFVVFWASSALLVSGGLIARRGNMGELDK
jgi:MFS family permease